MQNIVNTKVNTLYSSMSRSQGRSTCGNRCWRVPNETNQTTHEQTKEGNKSKKASKIADWKKSTAQWQAAKEAGKRETSTIFLDKARACVCKQCRPKDKATLNLRFRQAKTENDELRLPQATGLALLSPVYSPQTDYTTPPLSKLNLFAYSLARNKRVCVCVSVAQL